MSPSQANSLIDVQNEQAKIPLRINRVGISGMKLPILVKQRDQSEPQRTVAEISLGVDLQPHAKGTHMSRFVEKLQGLVCRENGAEALDYAVALRLMQETCSTLNADRAHISFAFPYFIMKIAPVSGIRALMSYDCVLAGEIDRAQKAAPVYTPFTLRVTVPVMTVCPCSKAISDEGAHSQRAEISISIRMNANVWIEDLVELAESAGSSPVYSLLKRADEKYVTETAFSQPFFVEDVARRVALALSRHPRVNSFNVEVQSYESIHAHNAFAHIEG